VKPDQTSRESYDHLLITVVLVLAAVLGAPRVWTALASADAGVDLLFYPVLLGGFGYLVVSRR